MAACFPSPERTLQEYEKQTVMVSHAFSRRETQPCLWLMLIPPFSVNKQGLLSAYRPDSSGGADRVFHSLDPAFSAQKYNLYFSRYPPLCMRIPLVRPKYIGWSRMSVPLRWAIGLNSNKAMGHFRKCSIDSIEQVVRTFF